MSEREDGRLVLVVRKSCFGLPTACPSCLPVYLYLRFAGVAFDVSFDITNPDSDTIPYVEIGDYVAFNNEKGGVIESLKEDGIVDLDAELGSHTFPDWLCTKAMICSWLRHASLYELWMVSDKNVSSQIYFSDLPWPIGTFLQWKQSRSVQQLLGLTKTNADEREMEIYKKSSLAYEALSVRLAYQPFLVADRPTSLDAIFLGHALSVLRTFPDTSVLRRQILTHDNLVKYIESHQAQFLEAGPSTSSFVPRSPHSPPPSRPFTNWSSKAKTRTKPKERTEEERTFRRRAKYFLATQLIAVLVFLSLMSGSDDDVELEDGTEVRLNQQE